MRSSARRLLIFAVWLAGPAGCADPVCTTMSGPPGLLQQAHGYQIDVFGAGVPCVENRAAAGASAPDQVRTFADGESVTFQVPAGQHTLVLTAFSAANEPLATACYQSSFSSSDRVCLNLQLEAAPDLGMCVGADCPCVSDDDCTRDHYCAATGRCTPGCRDNGDCTASSSADGGQTTVPLPICRLVDPHLCVACSVPADCVRPPGCQDNVRILYPAAGSPCVAGGCIFPAPDVKTCPYGCYEGVCTDPLAAPDTTRALQAGTQTMVMLATVTGSATGGGSAPATRDVEVQTEVHPRGSARAVTLTYFLNGDFSDANKRVISFTRKQYVGADHELWSAIIPMQPAGTNVYFFVAATGWDNVSRFDPGSMHNFQYHSN